MYTFNKYVLGKKKTTASKIYTHQSCSKHQRQFIKADLTFHFLLSKLHYII